jgi:hypothetical protein
MPSQLATRVAKGLQGTLQIKEQKYMYIKMVQNTAPTVPTNIFIVIRNPVLYMFNNTRVDLSIGFE